MPDVRPFRGLRYDERRAGPLATLIAPPYDVISPVDRAALIARGRFNAVELELPEAPAGADRYQAAAERLAAWQAGGVLALDAAPSLSLYEQEFPWEGRRVTRRGLIASVALTDWAAGAVLPHERTMSGPKEDRRALLRATRTNISPVFGIYEDPAGDLRAALDPIGRTPPAATAALEDGHAHRVWPISDPNVIAIARRMLAAGSVVIADGHHRYETALEYRREREQAGQAVDGDRFVLMVLVDLADPGLVVVPTHRIARDVPAAAIDGQLARLGGEFRVEDLTGVDPATLPARLAEAGAAAQAILVITPDRASLVTRPRPAAPGDPLELVETAVLERAIIRPVLEPIHGPAFPERVAYTRDAGEAIAAVRSGGASFAGLVNPTPPAIVKRVAEAGERMPQKTTYFYPKLSTGIVFRHLDQAAEPA